MNGRWVGAGGSKWAPPDRSGRRPIEVGVDRKGGAILSVRRVLIQSSYSFKHIKPFTSQMAKY